MEEQFCSYEIALKLKELGFDKPCFGSYFTDKTLWIEDEIEFVLLPQGVEFCCNAPLWQQAIDWFREKYKINCVVGYTDDDKEEFMAIIDRPNQDIDYNMNPTESYYEAREQAILKAIGLCQNKKS